MKAPPSVHPLLARQLKKLGLGPEAPTREAWAALLERVSATYEQADQDRAMLERSLELTSEEMGRLYDELRETSAQEIRRKNVALAESLALANAVQDAVADAIMVVGPGGRLLALNRRFREMFDVPDAALADGRADPVLAHVLAFVDAPADLGPLAQPSLERPAPEEVTLVDGRILERYVAPVRAPDGDRIEARVICYRDVTEQRRAARQKVLAMERMAAVGQLVAGVAHEINNPLAYVMGNLDFALSLLRSEIEGDDAELVEALADAHAGAQRIRALVGDLRALSRASDEAVTGVDVHAALRTALHVADHQLRHRATVTTDLREVPAVLANEARLTQVFLNLLVNAAQAIPEGDAASNAVDVTTRTQADGLVAVSIRDSGVGIPRDRLERIFDPFYTTKPVGEGTGLGLSICKGIIERSGGRIEVASEVGVGTTFTVVLPPAPADADAPPASERAPARARSIFPRRRVLVIDDEPQILRWLERTLSTHDVVAVSSVAEALDALERSAFDAVLCDLVMPQQTGADLHAILTKDRPELLPRLLFMSGGASTPALAAFADTVALLQKPIDPVELERAIARVSAPSLSAEEQALRTSAAGRC